MTGDIEELMNAALIARREHRFNDAKRDLEKSVLLTRTSGAAADLALALTRLGAIERDLRNIEPALAYYQEAAAIYRSRKVDALRLAHAVRHLGDIQQDHGRVDLAEPLYDEALAIYRGRSDTPPLDLANSIRGLALLKVRIGQSASARALWLEARDLYASVGVQAGVAESERRLAAL